jgi:F-type H+-transporting ATPase subunit gamma
MLQAKDLKNKIKSIKSINHITKAMKMVAAAKLKKAQKQMEATRPYSQKVESLIREAIAQGEIPDNPYLKRKENPNSILLVIISSDKGLCGSYNTSLIREFDTLYRQNNWKEKNLSIVTIGKKITSHIKKCKYNLVADFPNNETSPSIDRLENVFEAVIGPFIKGEVDEIFVLYTHYINNINTEIRIEPLLPVKLPEGRDEISGENFVFDPSIVEIFDFLMPRYVRTKFYSILINAITSEHSVRMTSMEQAMDKSSEMIEELELKLNKVRQESITLELLDIIGGAEALKN